MKRFLVLLFAVASLLVSYANVASCSPPPTGRQTDLSDIVEALAADGNTNPSAADIREAIAAEKDFLRTGPRLFSMADAQRESARTGKPVLCWMGSHIFASAKARERSEESADTTIQAAMDTDGETRDAKGNPLPRLRVKFSDRNYTPDAKVAFIPASKLDNGSVKKILAFTRGGSDKR